MILVLFKLISYKVSAKYFVQLLQKFNLLFLDKSKITITNKKAKRKNPYKNGKKNPFYFTFSKSLPRTCNTT